MYFRLSILLFLHFLIQEIELIHPKEHIESTIAIHKRHVNELYAKEFEFSNNLKLLFEYYKYPLENLVGTSKQIINQNEIDSIFKGISDIFQLSWTLCGELKILTHSYNHGYSTISIAGLFQKHAKQLKECYGRYASRYLFSIVTTHNLKKVNPNFKRFYKIVKKKFQSKKVELKTAFCLPIHQVQSYYDHFLRLQKSISPEDKSYELVEDGMEFFYDLTLLLKESLKRSIKIKEVYAIQKSIKDCPTALVHPYRILYKQFGGILDGDDLTCSLRLILFDDVIVIARKRKYHKGYVYDRAADYHVIQLLDSPSTAGRGPMITLLILSPFNNHANGKEGGYAGGAGSNSSGGSPNSGGYGYGYGYGYGNGYSNGSGHSQGSRNIERHPRDEEEILARGETFSSSFTTTSSSTHSSSFDKKFSRFFSWTFNQNITRLNLVLESERAKKEVMTAIQKRLKHLKPKPFEFLMLEPVDKYNFQQPMANTPQQVSPLNLSELQEILLSDEICNTLYTSIPKRLRIKRSLTLLYSMQLHGSSLSTFYERSNSGYGTSQILVLRDTQDHIFGAYTSEPFRKHNGFYGNGETFLWKVEPCHEKPRSRPRSQSYASRQYNSSTHYESSDEEIGPVKRLSSIISSIKNTIVTGTSSGKRDSLLRLSIQNNINHRGGAESDEEGGPSPKEMSRMSSVFSTSTTSSNVSTLSNGGKVKLYLWKQTNYFFINSTNEYVSIGSGGGKFGLWFDQQMLHGRSQVCETFQNEILSSDNGHQKEDEEFEIVDVELWAFTTQVEREVQRTRPSAFSTSK